LISFCKFHGFGNDYIVFEADELRNVASINDFARRVCQRHTGVGGDGIAVVEKIAATQRNIRAASSTRTAAKRFFR
jgi:diaminopimelate epimerase